MGDTILLRRGTLANLPDLQAGEPGWAEDANQLYIGTGTGSAASAMPIGGYDWCPESFTQTSIEAALTAIGTVNKVTLLLRPGNWVILTALAFPANVTVKMPPGAYFSGAGLASITFAGNSEVYPEWWGAKTSAYNAGDTAVATANATAINAALSTGLPVKLAIGNYNYNGSLIGVNDKDFILIGSSPLTMADKNHGEDTATGTRLNFVKTTDQTTHAIAPFNTANMTHIVLKDFELFVSKTYNTSAIYLLGAPTYVSEYGAGVEVDHVRVMTRDFVVGDALDAITSVAIEINTAGGNAFGWSFNRLMLIAHDVGIKVSSATGWFNSNNFTNVKMYQVYTALALNASTTVDTLQITGNYFANLQVQPGWKAGVPATGVLAFDGYVRQNMFVNCNIWDIGAGTELVRTNPPDSNYNYENSFIGKTNPENLCVWGNWLPTFTPTTSGSITLKDASKTGAYVKNGKQVTITGYFVVDSVSSPVGFIEISNLPYAAAAGGKYISAVSVMVSALTGLTLTTIQGIVVAGTTTMQLAGYKDGNAVYSIAANFQANTEVTITASYFVE